MVGSDHLPTGKTVDGRWPPRASQRASITSFFLPWSSLVTKSLVFEKNKLFPSRKRIHLSYRGIDPRYMGWMGGRGGVGWNDFQIKRKIKGSLVKFRNSWRVHRVPGFRISGGEAKR